MTYREQVLDDLRICDFLRYDDKRVVGQRMPVLQELEAKGLIVMRLVDVDEQESYLEVRLKENEE